MAVGKKTEMLATGGSDAVINLWYDSTAAEKEEAFRKEVCHLYFFTLILLLLSIFEYTRGQILCWPLDMLSAYY